MTISYETTNHFKEFENIFSTIPKIGMKTNFIMNNRREKACLFSTEIHISGRVQGVGFRPFIFNLAEEFGVKSYVSNDELGVIIVCQGENSEAFFKAIHERKPKSSEIIFLEIKEIATPEIFENFFIKLTEKDIVIDIPLTPDFATCEKCETELFDEKNPRYFIL